MLTQSHLQACVTIEAINYQLLRLEITNSICGFHTIRNSDHPLLVNGLKRSGCKFKIITVHSSHLQTTSIRLCVQAQHATVYQMPQNYVLQLCTEMFPWESFYGNDQIMRTVKLYYALYLNTNMTCNETNISESVSYTVISENPVYRLCHSSQNFTHSYQINNFF